MKTGSSQIRITRRAGPRPAGRKDAGAGRCRPATPRDGSKPARKRARDVEGARGEGAMQPEARSGRMDGVAAHPLRELLECPPDTGTVLNGSAQCISFETGETVFRQGEACNGLYVVVSGLFLRKAERVEARLTLGMARPGDLVELGAALGDGHHTYTLVTQAPGALLLLPKASLSQAFESYPPLRMQLLEELAREVCRAYYACCLNRTYRSRRRALEGEAGAGEAAL